MPYGNKDLYKSSEITKSIKHGETSDAKESALYREKLEFNMKINMNAWKPESFPSTKGSKHVDSKVLGSLASKSSHS
jgi:hypothetical protein